MGSNQDERVPERSVAFFAYMMRDTGSTEKAKAESKDFFARRKEQRDEDTEAGAREKGGRKMAAIPESFLVITRVIGLLRGLCAKLDVEVPLLEIFACHSRLAAHGSKVNGTSMENKS